MSTSESSSPISPPSNLPGYQWVIMTTGSTVPEKATHYSGELLKDDEVRIGRVYDGKCLYVGTAIPSKGVCIYLNKDLEVKSSSDYEIIAVDYYPRVNFHDIKSESSKLNLEEDHHTHFDWDIPSDITYWSAMVPVGVSESGELLGVAQHAHNKNTYYGWVSPSTKKAFFPIDAKDEPQVLEADFSVMLRGGIPRWALMKC